ncbi:uncharacterized protein F5147DRAFT_648909 [Suillus discolor]|uniref:Uncharacterized protein n=1 Tax=Suillus discolor TaxID=1912936 RepID=A0A9P7JZB0_9AGAM|nr:uncharacterized protein F5147DRAFT_648909 [Suillus discolor]KAG2117382.1 hypothetical protein F5147DRAFT_648909 [Suillus discolor]
MVITLNDLCRLRNISGLLDEKPDLRCIASDSQLLPPRISNFGTALTGFLPLKSSFYGDYEKREEPTDWLQKYELSFPTSAVDTDKLNQFELQWAAASPAESCTSHINGCTEEGIAQAKKLAQIVQGFNDSQYHLLDVILENTPEVLHNFMLDNYATWMDFKADVMKILVSQLLREKQGLAMEQKLCEDVDKLQDQIIQLSLQWAISTNPSNLSDCNPTCIPVISTAVDSQNSPDSANYRGYPQMPTCQGGSPADRMRTAAQYATISHHPNLDIGKQAYTQQIPYPSKPGTSPIGSQECFNCGMVMTPPHQAYDCPNEVLPTQETKWRETVSQLVSRTLTTPTMPGPMSNVQFISNAAAMPYAPQIAQAPYSPYSYFTEPYKSYNVMGNEYRLQL